MFLDKYFGRLGNRMFQMAALYAFAKEFNTTIFFQDPKWFEKYAEEIKTLFGNDIPEMTDRVSVHIRRAGNPVNPQEPKYADNPFYAQLVAQHHKHIDLIDEPNYYQRAMALFPNEKFLVFSDDIPWCKEYFRGIDLEFFSGTEEEDFLKMASCKHNIIANSSFSWWAAYLNKNPDKIVIAPKKWFANPDDEVWIGIPQDWRRI